MDAFEFHNHLLIHQTNSYNLRIINKNNIMIME
jgi:hypothetical protein